MSQFLRLSVSSPVRTGGHGPKTPERSGAQGKGLPAARGSDRVSTTLQASATTTPTGKSCLFGEIFCSPLN